MLLARFLGNYHAVLYFHPFILLYFARHKMQEIVSAIDRLTLNDCMTAAAL